MNKIVNLKTIMLLAFVVMLNACDGRRDFPPLTETGVTFENPEILLVSGKTDTVEPTFIPNINPARTYDWKIADPDVANIEVNEDYSASITATGSGETTVTITSQDVDSLTATANLKVIPGEPVDITSMGTLSVNRENDDGPEATEGSLKLVDNDIDTKFLSGYFAPYFMTLHFEQAQVVNFYHLTSANDAPERDPLDWQLLGSNDGENWEVLDEQNGENFADRHQTREFYFDNDTAYSYYRFNVTKNNGDSFFQMSEWGLFSIPEE